ncbi:MAG: ParA family protein [Armatimonadetes bacterium]|nr:ParA family protein [Armatimonadota bacterium]
MGRAFSVVNQKGGVAKTTTAINLAACAALDDHSVLVVDSDPQANATSGLGIDRSQLEYCLYDLLTRPEGVSSPAVDEVIVPTSTPNLDVLPATLDLAGAQIELASAIARERRLRRVLEPIRDLYDYIFVDTAPSLGILTINALAAVDQVLIPIQCEYYALEGLSQLLEVIALVQAEINPSLTLGGAILTMYDARTKLADEVAEEVRANFPGTTFQAKIPRNVRIAESPSYGLPVVIYDRHCPGSAAYFRLYWEVIGDA